MIVNTADYGLPGINPISGESGLQGGSRQSEFRDADQLAEAS